MRWLQFTANGQTSWGIVEGERVIASANFLIDAESKVQGALNDFEPSAARR